MTEFGIQGLGFKAQGSGNYEPRPTLKGGPDYGALSYALSSTYTSRVGTSFSSFATCLSIAIRSILG